MAMDTINPNCQNPGDNNPEARGGGPSLRSWPPGRPLHPSVPRCQVKEEPCVSLLCSEAPTPRAGAKRTHWQRLGGQERPGAARARSAPRSHSNALGGPSSPWSCPGAASSSISCL